MKTTLKKHKPGEAFVHIVTYHYRYWFTLIKLKKYIRALKSRDEQELKKLCQCNDKGRCPVCRIIELRNYFDR